MDATYLSLFIFLITTALYYFYKPNPDVGLLDGNDKDQSTFVKSGYVYLIIYVGFVILTQFFINVGILINKCGGNVSENFSAGALMTFIPWVFIFGSIVVILIAFPGFKSAFSNVIGYFVVAGRANTILAELLVDTDIDKEIDKIEDLDKKSEFKKAAQAVVKIFGDISVIINQMVPENFKEYWKLLTPLMREDVELGHRNELKKELFELVVKRDNIGEGLWYVYTAVLLIFVVQYKIVSIGCVKNSSTLATNHQKFLDKEAEEMKTKYNTQQTVYTGG